MIVTEGVVQIGQRGNVVEQLGNSLAVIGPWDKYVERGELWHSSYSWKDVADNVSHQFIVRCPSTIDVPIALDFIVEGEWVIAVYESPAISDIGNQHLARNMNRTFPDNAQTLLYRTNAAGATGGFQLVNLRTGTRRVEAGSVSLGYWVFQRGRDYRVIMTNNSGAAASATLIITFRE